MNILTTVIAAILGLSLAACAKTTTKSAQNIASVHATSDPASVWVVVKEQTTASSTSANGARQKDQAADHLYFCTQQLKSTAPVCYAPTWKNAKPVPALLQSRGSRDK